MSDPVEQWKRVKNDAELQKMIVFGFFMSIIAGAFLWTYTINSWIEFAGKEPSVVWWQGALLGMVPLLGPFSIPAAAITWVLLLIL